ncbi:MAG TPA: TA system VapC family ribonuclease toxin [Bryobacteraceae bacterium]|jgi:hypothetical protein|nr:TA system VapC family ribonuclease toxin [Bryobacteraceae bacterium]
MTLVDANILLYAYEAGGAEQDRASRWLERLGESGETIALPWVVLWTFIRVSTSPRVRDPPLPAKQAFSIVGEWIDDPSTVLLNPGPAHARILERLVVEYRVTGARMTGAILAALAIEHGAVLASADRDFARFTELRWVNPLAE